MQHVYGILLNLARELKDRNRCGQFESDFFGSCPKMGASCTLSQHPLNDVHSATPHGLGLQMITDWWFGSFLIFPYIGNNHPN